MSGDDIRQKQIFHFGDFVLEEQFLFLQTAKLKLIRKSPFFETLDGIIEITMLLSQLDKSLPQFLLVRLVIYGRYLTRLIFVVFCHLRLSRASLQQNLFQQGPSITPQYVLVLRGHFTSFRDLGKSRPQMPVWCEIRHLLRRTLKLCAAQRLFIDKPSQMRHTSVVTRS